MAKKTTTSTMLLIRSFALGVLLSILAMYSLHVFGSWRVENYRPDPETTSSLLLHNTCAVFDKTHTLRPGFAVSELSEGVDKTKLAGSFMNFFDGHVPAMLVIAAVLGLGIFGIRKSMRKDRQESVMAS